jgi:hypothetical protein
MFRFGFFGDGQRRATGKGATIVRLHHFMAVLFKGTASLPDSKGIADASFAVNY